MDTRSSLTDKFSYTVNGLNWTTNTPPKEKDMDSAEQRRQNLRTHDESAHQVIEDARDLNAGAAIMRTVANQMDAEAEILMSRATAAHSRPTS